MKNKLLLFFKGLILGSAIILPGISFSLIAIILNCYKEILTSISSFSKSPAKVIKEMYPLVLGIILSCLILFFPLSICLNFEPFLTIFFFTGVLIKCLINVVNKTKTNSIKTILLYILGLLFSFLFLFIPNMDVSLEFNLSINYFIYLIIICFISSLCAISPGLSITFVLLSIGFYDKFINVIYEIINSLIVFDFNFIDKYGLTFLFLFVFCALFLTLLSKTVLKILNNYENETNIFFVGAATSNIFITIFNTNIITTNETSRNLCYNLICCYTFLYLGYKLIVYLENKAFKRGKNEIR